MTQQPVATTSGLDPNCVGNTAPPQPISWTSRDTLLYALGVGAGQQDAVSELQFTTENSRGIEHSVLPTFAVTLLPQVMPPVGQIDLTQILHADQSVRLQDSIPVHGRGMATTRVSALHDKGKGALLRISTDLTLDGNTDPFATLETGLFLRGAGGFGGERGPSADSAVPDRGPDHIVHYPTSVNQALLYRLSGDRNPLHSDPAAASEAGFPKPILHGLCTFGFAGRALLATVCDDDRTRFGAMTSRFTMPVLPGQELSVLIWRSPHGAVFRVSTDAGVVLDQGRFEQR
jgi:acyl dehydratase